LITGWEYTHVGLWINGDEWIYDATMRHNVSKQDLVSWLGAAPHPNVLSVTFQCDTDVIRRFAESQLGHFYDWKSVILDKVFRMSQTQNPQWWFCSEFVFEAIKHGGCVGNGIDRIPSNMVMPRDLLRFFNNSGFPTVQHAV
jgi:hypothetical protein